MKKILFISLALAFLFSGLAYAEIGATAYSNSTVSKELGQYIFAYNGTATNITSNAVVILDTNTADYTSYGVMTVGARITTTTTNGDSRVLGVTDGVINAGSVGAICVRGPHKVLFTNTGGPASAGASVATSGTAGYAALPNVAGSPLLGVMLASTQTQDSSVSGYTAATEPPNLYWVYINN